MEFEDGTYWLTPEELKAFVKGTVFEDEPEIWPALGYEWEVRT